MSELTAFSIINRYMRFADSEVDKRRSEWKTNERWAYFIGSDRGRLKLTTKPEPYTLTRTLNWISRQVAPTWKVLEQIDCTNGTTYLKDILDHTKLTEHHKKLIEQQTTSTEEIITLCLLQAGSSFDRSILMAIVVIGVYLGFKREFSKLIGFLVVALIAVGLVFNAAGVKDVLLQLFNNIIGA